MKYIIAVLMICTLLGFATMSLEWDYWLVFFLLPFVIGFFFVVLSKNSSDDIVIQQQVRIRKKKLVIQVVVLVITALVVAALKHYIEVNNEQNI